MLYPRLVVLASPYRTAESAFYGTGSASQEVRHVTGTASPEVRHRKCVTGIDVTTGTASPEWTSQQECVTGSDVIPHFSVGLRWFSLPEVT